MRYLRRYRWRLFLLLGLMVVGCALSWLLLPRINSQWALTLNQQRWTSAQLTHYSYIFEPSCFCSPELTRAVMIEVNNGVMISIRYVDDGTPAKPDRFDKYATIDKLFALLQDALQQRASWLNVTYDPL